MAINDHVQSRSLDSASASSHALAFSGAVGAGSLLLVGMRIGSASDLVTGVSDSVNGAWTRQTIRLQSTDAHTGYIYSRANSAAGTPTVTITLSSAAGCRFGIQEASGFTAAVIDQIASAMGTSTNPSSGNTPTTTDPDELLFAVLTNSGGAETAVAGTGFTIRQSIGTGSDLKYVQESRVVASTGTYPGDWSNLSGTTNWTASIATFKGTAGGGGGTDGWKILIH